ncbi:MAG: BspA family leucine-rich repeat surface protein [Flavobacteriaceae bacterium]
MKKTILLLGLILVSCSKDSGGDSPTPEPLKFTLAVSAGEGGSVDTAGGTYNEGTTVTITATPNAEYLFNNWSGTESSTNNPLNIVLTSNENVTANFVKKQYELAITINGEGTVEEVVTQQGKEYASGTEVELTAVAAEGWQFSGWSGDIESTDNPITFTVDKAYNLDASFELLDTDGDGYNDDVDQCPDTPAGAVVDENGCQIPPIYLDENGVTIKARDFAQVGDTWEINGKIYKVVDKQQLFNLAGLNSEELTKVVTTRVSDMRSLFYLKEDMNFDISSWDVSNVVRMNDMFNGARSFNQDISHWDVSNVGEMQEMFQVATSFNQNLSQWDVGKVRDMERMFAGASLFNGDLSTWNVEQVTRMHNMFGGATSFNQDLSGWNVSNVTLMFNMFEDASSFNQDLSSWDVNNVNNCSGFSVGASVWTLPKPNFTNCNPN